MKPIQAHLIPAPVMVFLLSLSSSLAALWQAPCTPGQARAAEILLSQDELVRADSAYCALESECSLTPADLMKWMRIKAVLSQFSETGRIACLIVVKQADVAFLVQDQLIDLIKEAGIDTIRSLLREYCSCALSSRKQDTAAIRQWLAGAYDRFKLYDEEADALLKLDSKNYPSANDLYSGAQRRFARKVYRGTIQLALPAYTRLKDEASQSDCALMLYQSYAQTGKNDSAGLWLGKITMTRPENRARVIVFFQRTGLLAKADSLTATLPKSLLRDTLSVRQRLFAADFEGAAALAGRLAGTYPADRKNELQFFRIRALLFGGKGDEAEALIDSAAFSPAMSGAEEFLSYKYRCAVLKTSPQAWNVFGSIAYASWLSRSDKAAQALSDPILDACAPDVRQAIILDGALTLMADNRFGDARSVMERSGLSSASNEFRYYYGEVLYNIGAIDSARKVLEGMLLNHPGEVFSEKARIFLFRLNDQSKGGHHGNTLDEKRHH
jgi:hypothetical protein